MCCVCHELFCVFEIIHILRKPLKSVPLNVVTLFLLSRTSFISPTVATAAAHVLRPLPPSHSGLYTARASVNGEKRMN